MWDNPRLLNGIAAGLAAVALFLGAWGLYHAAMNSPMFPVHVVRVRGELAHVSRAQLEHALAGRVSGNFFSLDLEEVRAALAGLSWVRKVAVRRTWPDLLDVNIEEHVALARWGEDRLVDLQGEVFDGSVSATRAAALPLLYGPVGSERLVTVRYVEFKSILAPLELEPRQVMLSVRYAWRMRLNAPGDKSDLAVELGRDTPQVAVTARLARFASVYRQTLGRAGHRIEYVDLRYPNGFALRMSGMPDSDSRKKSARKNT
jgi:cell division protein FtsQ